MTRSRLPVGSAQLFKDGFWAKTKQEEIACPGLSVQFLVKIEDVSDAVLAKLKDVKPNEITTKLPGILNEISAKASEGTGYEVRVNSFFKGNQFLQFTYQRYKDVRLVGAPLKALENLAAIPITGNGHVIQAISLFSGYTWPRMENLLNIRLTMYLIKPKYFLPVSIKGVNDGDYAMIYGYPGGTNRYETRTV